jgi:hypothetical protein
LPRVPLPFWVLASFLLTLTSALALSQVKQTFMDVSEIQPGMKGYGLTVFRGDTPQRFGVEVIDVLHQFRPDQDLVLVRTQHPILEQATSVAGMSGSPVYLNERLIGAYAYGWSFGKEPIVGVTPIANMLAELKRPLDPQIWRALGTQPFESKPARPPHAAKTTAAMPRVRGAGPRMAPRMGPGLGIDNQLADVTSQRVDPPELARWGQPLPAATPLQISGLGPGSTELLTRAFGPYGLFPVQAGVSAGGAVAKPKAPTSFVDGGSIGVQLVRGDISVMAVGTVTHVVGRRLVAFGHPMLNAGQVALATCTARVVHVLSSMMRSFKLAEAGSPLGVLIQDRQSAIVIDQDLQPDMLPVHLRVHGLPEPARSEWNLELANNRLLTPGLLLSTISNALEASAADRTDSVLTVDARVALAGRPEERTQDVMFTQLGPTDGQALSRLHLFAMLGAAYGNPFEDVHVTGIDIDLHVRFERDLLSVVDVQLPSDVVDPGATVQLAVTLRHYDQAEHVHLVPIRIPTSAAGETLELTIEPGDEVVLDRPKPASLDDLLQAQRSSYPGTSLVVSTKLPSQGLKLRGKLVNALPGSALDMLQPTNEADRAVVFSSYERKEVPLGHAVTGSARLKINVRAEALR